METKKTKAEKAYNRTLLWRFLRGSKLYFLISMVSAAAASLCDMLTPQVIRVAVDNALGGKEANLPAFAMRMVERAGGFEYLGAHIWIFALVILAVAALKVTAQYAFRVCNTKGAETLTKTMRDTLFGHITSKSAFAATAGFTIFFPIPPKSCFTITIAKNAAKTGIQTGIDTGKLKPIISPVNAAEPSLTVIGFLITR
jgi:ABC-type multidrug transport system fused ATPase/permease subunit